MKFGKTLRRQAIPEWVEHYVDYKAMKQLIKSLVELSDIEEAKRRFTSALSKEASKVDTFYAHQLKFFEEKLSPLAKTISDSKWDSSDADQRTKLQQELKPLIKRLDQVRGFVVMNYLACFKILKKFDKRLNIKFMPTQLQKIHEHRFYSSVELAEALTEAQLAASILAGVTAEEEFKCPICMQVLKNPVTLTCAHRFCWQCLAKASCFGEHCPVCRKVQTLDPGHFRIDLKLQHFIAQHFQTDTSVPTPTVLDVEMSSQPQSASSSAMASPVPMEQPDDSKSIGAQPVVLTNISRIAHNHKKSKTLIILDLDETVIMSPKGSVLYTPRGLKKFQQFVDGMATEFLTKVMHCKALQRLLDEKVLVEADTAHVVKELQRRGYWVLGCTARHSGMAARTQVTLTRLSVDFTLNCPLPVDTALQDPDTQALFSRGVIYTNAIDKGDVLDRFLSNVLLSDPSFSVSEIVFVDDRKDNVESVMRNVFVAHKKGIRIHGYYYTAAHFKEYPADFDSVSDMQLQYFLSNHSMLTDEEARARLQANASTAVALTEDDDMGVNDHQ